jgi:hypothetical protein
MDFITRFGTARPAIEPVKDIAYDDAALRDANLMLAKSASAGPPLRHAPWGQLGDGTPEFHRQMGAYLSKRYPDRPLKEALRDLLQEEDEPILAELV